MQNCNNCKKNKSLDKFQKRGTWYSKQCYDCVNAKRRASRLRKKHEPLKEYISDDEIDIPDGMKQCTKCKNIKIFNDFEKRNHAYISHCRECRNAEKAAWKKAKRAAIKQTKINTGEIVLPNNPVDNKICSYCKKEQSKKHFRHNRRKCLDCEKKYGKKYRASDHGKNKSRQWVKKNRDIMTDLQAKWYQQNKPHINENYNYRYHNDPEFKFARACKNRIQKALKRKNRRKNGRTIKYLGCSISKLIKWFKYCFDDTMTLDNHGSYWHMDHVIPVNLWDLMNPEHVEHCFHWTNLSPMIGSENMAKHDGIDNMQLIVHMHKLLNYTTNEKDNYYVPSEYIQFCARHLIMTGSP